MKSKILFLMQLPPPVHGVTQCNQILKESKIISGEFVMSTIALNYSKSIEEMQRGGLIKLYRLFLIILSLFKELVFFRPKLVYFTISPLGSAFYRDVLLVIILKLFRKKIVYHLHGKGISAVKSGFVQRLYKFVFKNEAVICISKRLAEDIKHVKENANIYICENGITSFNDEKIKEPLKDSVRFLFLSNLSKMKGVDIYLDAMAQLIDHGLAVEINLAGPFSNVFNENDYNNILDRHPNLKKVIKYHGKVGDTEKRMLLNKIDVFVHPTHNDAFPLVLLEAMSTGCTLVSTEQGGIPDILENLASGFIVKPLNVDNLTALLTKLVNNRELLNKNVEVSMKEFNRLYTVKSFEQRVLNIFKSVIKG